MEQSMSAQSEAFFRSVLMPITQMASASVEKALSGSRMALANWLDSATLVISKATKTKSQHGSPSLVQAKGVRVH